MTDINLSAYPERFREIIEEFEAVDTRERMEYLIDYAMELPELPERLHEKRDQMEQVHECQSPVFLHTEIDNGMVQFYFDIPHEAPTVRGYAAILVDGLQDLAPAAVLATPDDAYRPLLLQDVVTPQRLRGLHFLMRYMKKQVERLSVEEAR
ncbi:MAG: SufE family protein [Chloroflexota bacterium]